jgi:hypothetical protein
MAAVLLFSGGLGAQEGKISRDGFTLYYRTEGSGKPIIFLSGGPGLEVDYVKPAAELFPSLVTSFDGCRFAIGIRNANNKRFRLACTVGLRVFVCHNLVFQGDYSPVLAKHSKHFSLEDSLSIGVDRMQT